MAGLDWVFLGRELPSRRSTLALTAIIVGAMLYVATDSEFRVNGFAAYTWIFIYFVLICIEVGASVRPSVRPSDRPSVRPSVRPSFEIHKY